MQSGTPAPRRTVYKRAATQDISPPVARRRSVAPVGNAMAGRPGGRSRLGTPMRTLERLSSVGNESLEGMEVDDAEEAIVDRSLKLETIFAKSDELQVSFYAHLPVEVKLLLRNADFYRDAYTGEVDTASGYALVASFERCFVWNYSQALTGTPTCYIFACPQDIEPLPMDTALHALVPYGPAREPGLILLSPGGVLHFWDSLAMGLAGGEPSSQSTLPLNADERVTTLRRADAQTFVVSTSVGRLFRLVLTASSGRYIVNARAFNRSTSMLSLTRLLPTFFSSPDTQVEAGYINAVALHDRPADTTGRDVWTLIDFRIQRWNMSTEGWEELIIDEDVRDLITPQVQTKFASFTSGLDLDLELLDLQVVSSDELIVLVSFAGIEEKVGLDDPQPKRIYALVPLSYVSGAFQVLDKKVQKVPYQSTSSSGAPMHPRIQLLNRGSIVSVQFGDTVALCAPETEYTDRLELKSASDRTLGVGVLRAGDDNTLMVLTAANLMKVAIDAEKVVQFQAATGKANIIKSTMTQAILYGAHPENPLHFSFPPDVDQDALMSGAEQLSQAIMESDLSVVRPNHDLQAQLTHRKERLVFLIQFINDNGVLTKMSQPSRQRLATDAEKLWAAHQLWQRHNDILGSGLSHNVLMEAVHSYMQDAGEGHHEDYMRAFFRLKAQDIGGILPRINDIIKRSSYEATQNFSANLAQANDAVLTVLQSAVNFRDYNRGAYGIELPLIQPWTSEPVVIDIVSDLFEATAKILNTPSAPSASTAPLRPHLPDLASALFTCYHEWCAWLDSSKASSEPGQARAKGEFEERFKLARPAVLDTLRQAGFVDHAFGLAEQYRDYRTLAGLCNSEREKVYPPEVNPYRERVLAYLEKFKEQFADELCAWYIEHGEVRTLFAQEHDQALSGYLDKFFASHTYPSVSWIHDVGKSRYDVAGNALLQDAEGAGELSAKELMLSIGKLAYLAHDADVDDRKLEAFHDGLDFVSVHEALLLNLRDALVNARSRQSLDQQVDVITRAKASRLISRDHRSFVQIFKQTVKRLLQGKALSAEDMADVLTLKDNEDERELEHYVIALRLLRHAKVPEARRLNAFRSVWRRIYLHDDWMTIRQTVNATDAEITQRFLNTAFCYVLHATVSERAQPQVEGFVLDPSEALAIPTPAQVQSRWPGMPDEDVEGILRDYEWESTRLRDYALGDVVERVKELAEGEWA